MDYKLLKQLKDAGFPQGKKSDGATCFETTEDTWAKVPTLSELIDACGEELDTIFRVGEDGWYARNGDDSINTIGKTPEESVAKLYLKLNG